MRRRLHANATTTPKTRAYIQASTASVTSLAAALGVSETTIRRWRGRISPDDRSHIRHNRGQATTPVEEAIIAELRRLSRLSLDDITEVMNRCINPHLSRGSVWTALRRAGLSAKLLPATADTDAGMGKPQPFEAAPFGYVHVDLRYLAKLHGRGEYIFVAIERVTRFVWIEIMPDRTADRVAATMARFLEAFGYPVHTVLPIMARSSPTALVAMCPTGRPSGRHAFDRLCAAHRIEHRLTRPYTPKTNGMVERFNRRIGDAIASAAHFRDDPHRKGTFLSHAERTAFLLAFVDAYNHTRLRCIKYKTPTELLTNQSEDNIRPGTTAPVRASNCDHFTTLETATPNRSATTRQLDPARTAATTRTRRSVE